MADKEATVYIIDVSRSMGKKHSGREESDLEWAMRYVWDKITTTVAANRKTFNVGVLGLGTDETKNELEDDEAYQHISVLHPISQILMPDVRQLQAAIRPSNTDDRDAVSALILAINMVIKHCKQLKWKRKIVLVTNGSGPIDTDPDNAREISKKINSDGMELVVLGVDFDDADYGFKEEGKSPMKAHNEKFLRGLVEECGGTFGTIAEAIDELDIPRLKITRPVHTFRGQLRLGDPTQYDTALCIDVERYPRTMIRRPESASSFTLRSDLGGDSMASSVTLAPLDDQLEGSNGNNPLTNVRNLYTYQINDPESEGGKRAVARDDLAKGYEYGRTAVHINESDENITKLETEAAMEIIGFVSGSEVSRQFAVRDAHAKLYKFERYILLEQSNIVIAQKTNEKAIIALSSLIHALYELGSCAIARVVKKDMAEPSLKILSPEVKPDYECLIENDLPFAEDVRSYRFPPLDKIVTVSGKIVTQHRNLPSDDLQSAMSEFVDKMDLSTFGTDENGEPAEYMPMEETFSPLYHRIEQAKRWRALHPMDPVPPIPEVLMKYSKPPEGLQNNVQSTLKRLIKAADVKKVPPKVKGRKRDREVDKPLSGLNVEDLFRKEKRTKISPENAIPEFKQALAITDSLDAVKDVVKQMMGIVEYQIRHSFGDSAYDWAVEELGVVRQEMIDLEEPGLYNDMLRELKRKIMAEELGGNRREMWWFIRKNRIGLIDKKTSPVSDVTEEEANTFLQPT